MKLKKLLLFICMISLLLGCEDKEIKKDKLITETSKINTKEDEEDNIKAKGLISKEQAKKIAMDGFENYLDIDIKTVKLPIKIHFIQRDKDYFYYPVDNIWNVCWVNEKNNRVYTCDINAENGEILGLDITCKYKDIDKTKDRKKSIQECKKTAYEFINKHKLLENKKDAQLSELYANPASAFIVFDFTYDTDKKLSIAVDEEKNKVTEFHMGRWNENSVDYTNLKINKEQAKKLVLDKIEKCFGQKIDTTNLVEDINVYEQKDKTMAWFVYWHDVKAQEEYKEISYGGNFLDGTGNVDVVECVNRDLSKKDSNMTFEEGKKIAIDFINKNKLYDNIEKVECIKEKSWESIHQLNLAFKCSKGKYIHIGIDTIDKKVIVLRYDNDIDLEKKTKK